MNSVDSNSKNKSTGFWESVLTSGLIIGGLIVLTDLIVVQLLGIETGVMLTMASVLGVYFTQIYYRNVHKGGYITYGEALKYGTLSMGAAGVIRGVYVSLLFKFIPGLWEKIILTVEEVYFNMGMSDADLAVMLEPVRNGVSPVVLVIAFVIASMASGLFISLISSIFIKNSNPDSFNDAMHGIK